MHDLEYVRNVFLDEGQNGILLNVDYFRTFELLFVHIDAFKGALQVHSCAFMVFLESWTL